jgi:hypothetical protein
MKSNDQILLENTYQKVLENWRYYRGGSTPSYDPLDDGPDLACPICDGPMYDAQRGGSDKWAWDFKCKDENCKGDISGDNLP